MLRFHTQQPSTVQYSTPNVDGPGRIRSSNLHQGKEFQPFSSRGLRTSYAELKLNPLLGAPTFSVEHFIPSSSLSLTQKYTPSALRAVIIVAGGEICQLQCPQSPSEWSDENMTSQYRARSSFRSEVLASLFCGCFGIKKKFCGREGEASRLGAQKRRWLDSLVLSLRGFSD